MILADQSLKGRFHGPQEEEIVVRFEPFSLLSSSDKSFKHAQVPVWDFSFEGMVFQPSRPWIRARSLKSEFRMSSSDRQAGTCLGNRYNGVKSPGRKLMLIHGSLAVGERELW